jgi:hypothetical protein
MLVPVMPSQHQALPVSMVEAMFGARRAVVADAAGRTEFTEVSVASYFPDTLTSGSVSAAFERLWESRREPDGIGMAGAPGIKQPVELSEMLR